MVPIILQGVFEQMKNTYLEKLTNIKNMEVICLIILNNDYNNHRNFLEGFVQEVPEPIEEAQVPVNEILEVSVSPVDPPKPKKTILKLKKQSP